MIRFIALLTTLCAFVASGMPLTGFRHITVSDGLPRNGVFAILPSRLGPVYIGTWDGLFELCGSSVREIMFTPSSSTPVLTVNALAEDSAGNLWVGTSGGLIKYDISSGICSPVAGAGGYVSSLSCDAGGNIRIIEGNVDHKIIRCRTDSVQAVTPGLLFAGYRNVPANFGQTITDSRGHVFAYVGPDVYEASADSVFRKVWHSPYGIEAMAEYNGRILLGGNGGLTAYDPATRSAEDVEIDYSDPDGLNDRRITALAVDAENGLWVGTFYGGVNYRPPSRGDFSLADSLNTRLCGHVISGITRDALGRLWLGIEDGGVACYDPDRGFVKNYCHSSAADAAAYSPAVANVQTVFADGMTLYVGTAGAGLDIVNLRTMTHERIRGKHGETEIPASVYAFTRDSLGIIWVGTAKGLFTYSPATRRFRPVDNVPGAIFHCLTTDSDGTVWAASQGAGLYSFSPHRAARRHDLPSDMIMSVCPTDSLVYVGTEGDGLFSLNPASGRTEPVCASEDGRLMAFAIVNDGKSIWVSTNKGLMHYVPASGRRPERFTLADGLLSNQFKINSGLRMPDGLVLMGSVSGVCAFRPDNIAGGVTAPAAFLTDFLVDSNSFSPDSAILVANRVELPDGSDNIEFRFASSSHADPTKNVFEYMLEPLENSWRTADRHASTAAYGALPPGSYVFRLRTSNGNGLVGPERQINVIVPSRSGLSPAALWGGVIFVLALAGAFGIWSVLRRRRPRTPGLAAPTPPESAESTGATSEFMSRLNEIIDAHIDNSTLTVDDLASFMAMGRSSFFAKVKELTGQTPNDYLRTLRLIRAADLLADGSLRINEVAYRVGFTSPSYFARRFAERYGVTPAEYSASRLKKS